MQRCNMYKLYVFYIQNCTLNPNQSLLLQHDLMDPNLLSAEVLMVAMLERMKVEMMKVERKKHPKLQCFVLFHVCNRIGLQETHECVFVVWAHRLAKLLFLEKLYAILHQLHSFEACVGGTRPCTVIPLPISIPARHYHRGSIPQLT